MPLFNIVDGEVGDPLMPSVQRFPVNVGARPLSDESPSTVRPFILRSVQARRIHVAPEAKHRTTAHDTFHARNCNEDGKLVDDSYTTPDD
jgi:hypothetical protein